MPHDTTFEQPVSRQQSGKAPPLESDQEEGKAEAHSPWSPSSLLSVPGDLFSKAAKAIPSQFPNIEVSGGDAPVQAVRAAQLDSPARLDRQTQPAERLDFRPGGGIQESPLVEKTIRKIKDSPDPVLEAVNLIAGGLDNVRAAKIYQTVYGDYQLQMSLNRSTCETMVDKSVGPFSSGPVRMDNEVMMRAGLQPDGSGGAMLQLHSFSGVHPSIDGPLKSRSVLAGGATLFKGNDGDYHMEVSGQASWGLRRTHWGKTRNITINPENVRDPFLRGMMQEATDIDRTLADLLKVQQSQDILSIGIQRVASSAPGAEQFDMSVRSRREKHVPLDKEASAGLPVKVDSVDLATDVAASLSYSRESGIALHNINGVKLNLEMLGGIKQVVSPTQLTFGRDAAGKASVGVQFVMHDAEGKPSAPMNIAIPFSRIIQELNKRKPQPAR